MPGYASRVIVTNIPRVTYGLVCRSKGRSSYCCQSLCDIGSTTLEWKVLGLGHQAS